jgi:hypothetical protein
VALIAASASFFAISGLPETAVTLNNTVPCTTDALKEPAADAGDMFRPRSSTIRCPTGVLVTIGM